MNDYERSLTITNTHLLKSVCLTCRFALSKFYCGLLVCQSLISNTLMHSLYFY